ncbi:MAG: cell division regulator GpsB [Mollicutes bacterium]|nr:cell division regulator GpsB [Mollicutes bacterium]
MNKDKINLTPQEILEHDFKLDARGYRPQEVDKYLDLVISDYTEYDKIIVYLEKQIDNLTSDNYKLKEDLRHAQDELAKMEKELANSPKSVTNIDLLRRISQLEKTVYGKEE